MEGQSWGAPVSPVSSSVVNKHSSGGSLAVSGRSSNARAVATPRPLSAPKVVPCACSRHSACQAHSAVPAMCSKVWACLAHASPISWMLLIAALRMTDTHEDKRSGQIMQWSGQPEEDLTASCILLHTLSQSPFLWSLRGSLKKSCCTSAFFSVTMSTCPCTQNSKVILSAGSLAASSA